MTIEPLWVRILVDLLATLGLAGIAITVLGMLAWKLFNRVLEGKQQTELVELRDALTLAYEAQLKASRLELERRYEQETETFSQALQARYDDELDRVRAGLGDAVRAQQAEWAELHKRRSDVIQELYRLVLRTEKDFSSLTDAEGDDNASSRQARAEIAHKGAIELRNYIREHLYYFNRELGQEFEAMLDDFSAILVVVRRTLRESVDRESPDQARAAWAKINDSLIALVVPVKNRLADEFQEILSGPAHPSAAPDPGAE